MIRRPGIGRDLNTLDDVAWSAALDAFVFPVTSAPKRPETFSVDVEMWTLGNVSVLHHVCDAIQYRREPQHVRCDKDEWLLIPFSIDASLRFEQDGIERTCKPSQFIIERSASPYVYQQENRGELWTLKIPVAAFLRNARRLETFVPYVFDASTGPGALLLDLIRMVPRHLAATSEQTAAAMGGIVIDLLVSALDSDARVLGSQQGSVQRAHLARIERYIRQNLGDRLLEPTGIAAANGISLRYLHKLFADSGTSVGQWILEKRLDACDIDLRRAIRGETVAEIGYRWGFTEAAHFSRVFKARYGVSPRERRLGAS